MIKNMRFLNLENSYEVENSMRFNLYLKNI